MILRMNGDRESLAIFAQVVIGAVRMHALESGAIYRLGATVARGVVHLTGCCTNAKIIFGFVNADKSMVGMLFVCDAEA
jgi:hypothetical protein